MLAYFACRFDALDETEEDYNPGKHEAQYEVPVWLSKTIYTRTYL